MTSEHLPILRTYSGACSGKWLRALALIILGFTALPATLAAQAGAPEAVRVGGTVKPPTRVKAVPPVYPPAARQGRTQGVVILEAVIGIDGKVKNTKIVKSIPMLDAAAVDAVKKWEYQPTLIAGQATPVIVTIPVNFKLN